MITDGMLTRPLAVTNPGGPQLDDDGQPVRDARGRVINAAPTVDYVDGYVEVDAAGEITDGQQTAPLIGWVALPAGTAVSEESTVRIIDSDQTFEVTGAPTPKWNPWERHIEWVRVDIEEHS